MSGTAARPVVLLAGPGPSTNIVHHALAAAFPGVVAVIEDPVPRSQLVRRRAKRLGWRTVTGQVLFMGCAAPVLGALGRRRVAEILGEAGLVDRPVPAAERVPSVNSEAARDALRRLDPSVVVVNGTRIISAATLGAVPAPFVNMHAGITPRYRGVHGGYWALAEGRPDLVGTTIHLIDTGIDTGPPLAQVTFDVTRRDSFATYPYLHLAAGIPLLLRCVTELSEGRTEPVTPPVDAGGASVLRYHPTLWSYARDRIRRGVA